MMKIRETKLLKLLYKINKRSMCKWPKNIILVHLNGRLFKTSKIN